MSKKAKADDRPYRPCVGLALFNRQGRVFVAKRKDTPDAWQMPQGGIDKGEEPKAAALRELKEETGVENVEFLQELDGWLSYDLPADLSARIWRGKYRGQTQKWFAFLFLGQDREIDLESHHQVEFDSWRWADVSELPDLIVGFKKPVYEAVAREFAPLAARLGRKGPA
jgi:putative (di)nucleoside polyphosphate hydrolase